MIDLGHGLQGDLRRQRKTRQPEQLLIHAVGYFAQPLEAFCFLSFASLIINSHLVILGAKLFYTRNFGVSLWKIVVVGLKRNPHLATCLSAFLMTQSNGKRIRGRKTAILSEFHTGVVHPGHNP